MGPSLVFPSSREYDSNLPIEVDDRDRIRLERDLLLRVLELGDQRDVEPFLAAALDVLAEAMRAKQGYLEIEDIVMERTWSRDFGYEAEEIDHVRQVISRGIIAEALATQQTVATADALIDERFRGNDSVQRGQIDAVLCVPLVGDGVRGVLYLQGRSEPGPFGEEDRELAELLARRVTPFVERVTANERDRAADDAVAPLRDRIDLGDTIGSSRALADALEQAALAAPWEVVVLLTGASGTGKSALARVIHRNSRRSSGPLIELNCGALPEQLIENELFGAEAGAHSTAPRAIEGKVDAAKGGTLFLDEIGELPLGAQASLLRLIDDRRYLPLGASDERAADIRIIAATNVDLVQATERGSFRQDLLYRLQVMQIRMPNLAERQEDVAPLARFFVRNASERHGIPIRELSDGAVRAIRVAEWPGNIRQLENAVEAATIRAAGSGATAIERAHVFPELAPVEPEAALRSIATWQAATAQFQREHLLRALKHCDWNVSETARQLDLSRSYLYELIETHAIEMRRRR